MDKAEDAYYTIKSRRRAEIKIKGSKFIGTAIPAANKEAAKEELGKVRSEFYDATHNCFAHKIGSKGLEYGFSDDGEPSGSAGKPILFEINKYDVSNVLVVVTRYFGGTKLGVGGLSRAYSQAAAEALNLCDRKKITIVKTVSVHCTYEDVGAVKRLVAERAVKFEETYLDAVEFEAKIPESEVKRFQKDLTELTAARAGCVLKNH